MDGHTYLIVRLVAIVYTLLVKVELNTFLLFQLTSGLFCKSFRDLPLNCRQDSLSSMLKRRLLKFVMLCPYGVTV
jgi:hypothetical protein